MEVLREDGIVTARCSTNIGSTSLNKPLAGFVRLWARNHAMGIGVFFNGENTGINLLV